MEVWALGLRRFLPVAEFLTVKSDDVTGRRWDAKIVKGDNFLEAGLPESFNVRVELMSLGLNVTSIGRKARRGPAKRILRRREHQYLQQQQQQDMADE